MRTPSGNQVYGMGAEYPSAAALYEAAKRVRDAGFKRWDVHSPFPIHGMDEAMGLGKSWLRAAVRGGGWTGLLTGAILGQGPSWPILPVGGTGKAVQGGPEGMIEMRGRQEHEIDPRQVVESERRLGEAFRAEGEKRQANADAIAQRGIGEDGDAVEINQHGGVAEPGRGEMVVAPGFGSRTREGRRDRRAVIRFAPKMSQPTASLHRELYAREGAGVRRHFAAAAGG